MLDLTFFSGKQAFRSHPLIRERATVDGFRNGFDATHYILEMNNQQLIQQMPVEEEDEDHRANDEEEEDEDDNDRMEEEDEEEEAANPGEEGVLEGGVAEGDESRTLASEADIVLYFLCIENFRDHPDHPILRPGVKVRIGLGKNTRLSAVMQRYVEVCNQIRPDPDGTTIRSFSGVELSDLEFAHASLLRNSDTAEQGALMKDDVVRVRQNRCDQVEQEREATRLQRESDLVFLDAMREMCFKPSLANVVLDCQGTLVTTKNTVLSAPRASTLLRCDAALVSRRCPWLGRLIEGAVAVYSSSVPLEERPKSVVSTPEPLTDRGSPPPSLDHGGAETVVNGSQRVQDESVHDEDDIDDHPIQVLNVSPRARNQDLLPHNEEAAISAAQIECDDESQGEQTDFDSAAKYHVTIPNHAPEPMELLLEYCYTHRVVGLGNEAFRAAARTKLVPRDGKGNVPPQGSKRWVNRGEPSVPFDVAAAGITLAEEASMPRLSLMCEVAASMLVAPHNVIEALSLCQRTQDQWGNPLPRLRRASMEVVFHSKPFGIVYDRIYNNLAFKEAVQERASLLVPALFTGTADAVEECLGKKRHHSYRERDWKVPLFDRCRRHDQEDKLKRAKERSRSKNHRDNSRGSDEYPLIVDELDAMGNDVASRKCMKRLRAHSVRSSLRRAEKRERRGSH